MNVRGVSVMGGGSVGGLGLSRSPIRRRRWRRHDAPAFHLFLMAMLIAGSMSAGFPTSTAFAWQSSRDQSGSFDNPPLQYDGPDPTSGYFFMAPRTAMLGAQNTVPQSTVPQYTVPPLNSTTIETVPPPDPGFGEWMDSSSPMMDEWMAGEGLHCGVTDHKDGFFQKLSLTETWIDQSRAGDYGLHEIDTFVTVAVPAPRREWPLLITPTFNLRLLDGPVTPDLPPQVYEAYVDFMWVPRISPRWLAILGVAPGYYSDFEVDSEKAFRLTGKALVRFDWIPDRLQLLFGVLYLNRDDIRLLPAGGIIWTPNDAKRYELVFPRPKLAHRIVVGDNYEDWLYIGGEFGGNSYAIERVTGAADVITLRDIRVYIGLERKKNGGAGYLLEAGYVFSRRVEYSSATPDINADDALVLRGGVRF